jgi:hypothetical protein
VSRQFAQQYWVRGKYLGESARDYELVHGTLQPPESLAYFCPTCGEVWARVVVTGRPFSVWTMTCERHAEQYRSLTVPGTLYMSWNKDHNEALPREVLRREVILHAEWCQRTAGHSP